MEFAKQHGPLFAKACLTKTVSKVQSVLKSQSNLFNTNFAALKAAAIASATKPPNSLPDRLRGVLQQSCFLDNSKLEKKLRLKSTQTTSFDLNPSPVLTVVEALERLDPVQLVSIPVFAIKARTEKWLWHQRLGHPKDRYLYDAHKSMTGVPKFTRESDVMSTCPTCILAKQTKSSPGHQSTRTATEPHQGLSIDFAFSGQRNIIWYDVETHKVKIATHARFDEGFNDLPMDTIPPNGQHLIRTDDGNPFPAETRQLSLSNFGHFVTPFQDLQLVKLSFTAKDKDDAFGLRFADDPVLSKPYIANIKDNSPTSHLYSTHKASWNQYCSAYIVEINGTHMITAAQATAALRSAHGLGVYLEEVQLLLTPKKKLSTNTTRRAINEQSI